jgi:hypothetical protein
MAADKSLDEVLNKHDRIQRVYELLRAYGADEQQAHVGSIALAEKFTWTGSVLNFNETGKIAADDPACKAYIAKDFGFLIPAATTDKPKVDTSFEEQQAFGAGNVQARGVLVRKIGEAAANERAIAWGLGSLHDYKKRGMKPTSEANVTIATSAKSEPTKPNVGSTNPWSEEGWSPAKQLSVVKAMGAAKASEIARAATPPSFLGAPRPGATNLTSFRRTA